MRHGLLFGLILLAEFGGPADGGYAFRPVPDHAWDFTTTDVTDSTKGGTTDSFARTGTTSRIQGSSLGSMASVADATGSITAALDSDGTLPGASAPRGLHLSEAVTFGLIFRGLEIDNAAWSDLSSPTVTANVTTDMFGAATFDSIDDNAAGAVEGRTQTFSVSGTNTYKASAWTTCGAAHSVDFTLALSGGGCTPIVSTTTFTCSGILTKVTATVTNDGVCDTGTVTLRGTQDVASQTGECRYTYVQAYSEDHQSIVDVEVAGSTVTHGAESITFSSLAPGDTGTLCTWYWPNTEGGKENLFEWAGASNFLLSINDGASGQLGATVIDVATSATVTSTTFTERSWNHVCFTWAAASGVSIYMNGAVASYGNAPDDFTAAQDYGTTFRIGPAAIDGLGEVVYSRVKFWVGRELTAVQVKKLYNRERARFGYGQATGDGLP